MLKEGGTLVYSTCSMNAIENEAIVATVMKEYLAIDESSLELINLHDKLSGFKL